MIKRLSTNEAYMLGLEVKKNKDRHGNPKYSVSREQWRIIQEARNTGLVDAFARQGVDPTVSPDLWLKGKDESIRIKNPFFKEKSEKSYKELEEIAVKSVSKFLEGKLSKFDIEPPVFEYDTSLFDVLVFTDAHIGMEPNKTGFSLYGGVWDESEIEDRLAIMIKETLKTKNSNKLIIFELGDFMDGWDGETVRKGHKLPQNMSNEKAFDVGLNFKIQLVSRLAEHYQEIQIINICDDNHAGSFGYVVNSAFKNVIEGIYTNVNVINQRKFIDHYVFGNKVFIATHGKDGANLKFGFKPKLDPVQIEKIDNYLFENNLVSPDLDIYFLKGDSHQDIFDNSTSQKFKYWNFPAFSPSSNWVQTNFKKGISGFYNISFDRSRYTLSPYYFNWKKNATYS